MEADQWQSLPAMFFAQAARMGSRPFLWSKRAGRWQARSYEEVAEAVRRFDPALGDRVIAGEAYVTDGRGIEVDPDQTLASGAILRVVVRARRGSNADA